MEELEEPRAEDTLDNKVCLSFLKTATCELGDSCHQRHHITGKMVTVLLPNFFRHPALLSDDPKIVENTTVEELEEEYGRFYIDVIWRFRTVAPVLMFKCSRNTAPHLCGNVYVEYATPEQASTAVLTFNSALSEQYNVEARLCHVTNWRSAICGLASCPMGLGSSCEYLHVFNNPGNEYAGRPRPVVEHTASRPQRPIGRTMNSTKVRSGDRSRSRSPPQRRGGDMTHRWGNKPKPPCIYYNKTGACVFGAECPLRHRGTGLTPSVLVPNFFEYVFASYDENDRMLYEQFYHNTLAWFNCIGTVTMYKCCKNLLPHLKGNLYVQFESHELALQAVNEYNGTEYDGKQIEVKLCPITNWKGAICRASPCTLGVSHCTDLHVYSNPGNEFAISRWE